MSAGIIIKSDPSKTIEQVRAEVAAFEANPLPPDAPDVPSPTASATAPATPPEKAATPEPGTPPAKEKAEPTQQPKETPEKVASEPPKAAEPAKDVDWQSRYKGATKERDKTVAAKDKEIADLKAKLEAKAEPEAELRTLSPEWKKKVVEESEKDFPEAIVKVVREVLRGELNPIKSKLQAADAAKVDEVVAKSLQAMVDAGDDWIAGPDGPDQFAAVFDAHPELDKLPPEIKYQAARSFINIPSKASQRGPAQTTGLTPMLGAGGAVPPVVSTQAVSTAEKLITMQAQLETFQKRGQWDQVNKMLAEMDAIQRG